jgi:hypothetical protein
VNTTQEPPVSIKTISDQIKIIRVKQAASDTVVIITAVTRAVIAVAVVVSGAYLLATGVPIPEQAWSIALLVVGGLFGIEAVTKVVQYLRNGKE